MADAPLRPDPSFDASAPPRVAGSSTLWPVMFGIVGALGLGTVVFLQLANNRTQVEQARLTDPAANATPLSTQGVPPPPDMSAYQAPPPLPPAPPPEPEPVLIEQPPAPPLPPPGPTQQEIDRARAPALVVDLGEYRNPEQQAQAGNGNPLDPKAVVGAAGALATPQGSADDQFAQRMGLGGEAKTSRARTTIDQSTTIVEGSIIPAVLETALNSDLPGYARAVVSRDVRSFDGSQVLVPRGSRLIGQYKSGVALGQSRAFVIWTRLIRPDGADIELSSPATDALGRGGLTGKVDTHFFQRFGGAILLSLVNLGIGSLTDASDTAVVIAATRSGGDTFTQDMSRSTQISPTVKVPQGSPVRVFVSQDLDFSTVGPFKPEPRN